MYSMLQCLFEDIFGENCATVKRTSKMQSQMIRVVGSVLQYLVTVGHPSGTMTIILEYMYYKIFCFSIGNTCAYNKKDGRN